MRITLTVDDELLRRARRRADALGTSVHQLVRDFLTEFAGASDPNADAAEFGASIAVLGWQCRWVEVRSRGDPRAAVKSLAF